MTIQQTFTITAGEGATFDNTDPTTLNGAIRSTDVGGANAATNTAYTIDITGQISLASDLLAINLPSGSSLTIDGSNGVQTIDGGATQRGFFVYAGNVTLENLTIANAIAQGGNGGPGGGGPGSAADSLSRHPVRSCGTTGLAGAAAERQRSGGARTSRCGGKIPLSAATADPGGPARHPLRVRRRGKPRGHHPHPRVGGRTHRQDHHPGDQGNASRSLRNSPMSAMSLSCCKN